MRVRAVVTATLLIAVLAAACNPVIGPPDPGSTSTTSTSVATIVETTSTEAPTSTTEAPTTTVAPTTSTTILAPTLPITGHENVVTTMLDDATLGDIESGYMPRTQAALAAETGIHTFTKFYAQDPLCSPSRVTYMTGLTSVQHGVNCNTTADICPGWINVRGSTLQVQAHNAGFFTALSGKLHNAAGDCAGEKKPPGAGTVYPNSPGWDDYHALYTDLAYDPYKMVENGALVTHKVSTGGIGEYGTYYEASLVDHNLTTAPEPFYQVWTPSAPHQPGEPAPDFDPTQVVGGMPLHSPAFNEGCVGSADPDPTGKPSDKPLLERDFGDEGGGASLCLGSSAWTYAKNLKSLQAVDWRIPTMIAEMKARPSIWGGSVWDHTIWILTSDNGQEKGDHGHGTKEMPRERSLHLPLIIRIPGTASATHADFTYMPDLAVTIADYMGVTLPGVPGKPVAGLTLRPLLEGTGTVPARTLLFSHPKVQAGIADVGRWYMIRSATRQVEFYPDTGEWGLYDLTGDPNRYLLVQLAADPTTGYAGIAPWNTTGTPENTEFVALQSQLMVCVAAGFCP